MCAWSVTTRRAPSRHCRDSRAYGHKTTPMHDMNTPLPPTVAPVGMFTPSRGKSVANQHFFCCDRPLLYSTPRSATDVPFRGPEAGRAGGLERHHVRRQERAPLFEVRHKLQRYPAALPEGNHLVPGSTRCRSLAGAAAIVTSRGINRRR